MLKGRNRDHPLVARCSPAVSIYIYERYIDREIERWRVMKLVSAQIYAHVPLGEQTNNDESFQYGFLFISLSRDLTLSSIPREAYDDI